MMRIVLVFLLITLLSDGYSQILPGMSSSELRNYMAESFRGYVLREPPNVKEVDFIKYEHISGERTLVVFFAENGMCSFTRLIVDIDYLEDLIGQYDNDYNQMGENIWMTSLRGDEFIISIEESEWMFTVTVRRIDDAQK